jgi:hypothetical protein
VKFGRDRLIVSNGKTGKCHFVAGELWAVSCEAAAIFYLSPENRWIPIN